MTHKILIDNSGSTWDGVPLRYTKEPIVPLPSIFLEIKTLKFMYTSPSSYGILLELSLMISTEKPNLYILKGCSVNFELIYTLLPTLTTAIFLFDSSNMKLPMKRVIDLIWHLKLLTAFEPKLHRILKWPWQQHLSASGDGGTTLC